MSLYSFCETYDTLSSHLVEIDTQAKNMFFQLAEQMAEQEGITEQLKADKQMEWVSGMNNIRQRTEEIINIELIYF